MRRLANLVVMGCAAAILAMGSSVMAKTITVHMKDNGKEGMMVFEPSFVKAAKGDSIHFVPDNGSHNAESIANFLPAGATPIKGQMGKDVVLTASVPGLYGIKCMPHYSMGMVALIQVGKPTSDQIAAGKAIKVPPLAVKRMTADLAKVH